MIRKAVFSTVLIHICLYSSHVWGAAGALEWLRHTGLNRQRVWAQDLARVTWAWFPQDGLQWGLAQPEGQRNDTNILCSLSRTCPPQPCPFPCSDACFQEDQASCVMERWMRGGRGGWDKEEKMDRDGADGPVHVLIWGSLLLWLFSWQAQAAGRSLRNMHRKRL